MTTGAIIMMVLIVGSTVGLFAASIIRLMTISKKQDD